MRAALERVAARVLGDAEGAGVGLPEVLLVVVVLGRHGHLVGHQERRVEAHAELPDHVVHLLRVRLQTNDRC